MQPLEADEPAGIGPYRLLGRLGSGGMGRVYLGRSAGGRTVAVKIVHPHFALDEEFRARFRREVAAARRVGDAWTAPVLDADPDAPVPWVATGYAAGPSLAAAVAATGPLPEHTVRGLGAGLAEALGAVHGLGLVHRDVKPSNVLLTLDGPLLIDFGIARATDGTASLTSTGVSLGSPGYMAPEQILGKAVTGAADVFSLGAVLVHAATGASPFPGDSSAALLYKVVHEEPELGALTGPLREVALACLAKDPTARPTPAELGNRLAPEGAARLITGGWLPGPLVEQVSRSAVHLLNLDTSDTHPSGPLTFPPGALHLGTGSTGSGEAGGQGRFGPAPVMQTPAGPAPVSAAALTAPPAAADGASAPPGPPAPDDAARTGGAGGNPDPAAGRVPHQAPAPNNAPAPPPKPPGRLSLSLAATTAPTETGHGRKLSCTLALAVAGALALTTLGLGALLRPWFTGGDESAGGSNSARTPAPSTGAPSGRPGVIPARYLGTWEGQATGTALGSTVSMGTFRVTVHQAAVGQELGRLKQTDQIGAVCTDILTLKKVTRTQLLVTSAGAEGNHLGCDPAPHQIELTPVGDRLKYTSDSAAEGNPESLMSKVG
ncbi:serine/threonine-protein kinase [Streptomyces sp. NPDC127190]|uniref:serine/threonine-protein kinase n=1 Tax=unclassified Streptomyces TaxID=2593676 RepID=UPI00363E9F15